MTTPHPLSMIQFMKATESAVKYDVLFDSQEQDERTARSARMIANQLTDEEIELLMNQPPIQNEYRQNISK